MTPTPMTGATEVASPDEIGGVRQEVSHAAGRSIGDGVASDVALVVSELVTNALEHGDDRGVVSVVYGPSQNGFEVAVTSPSSGMPVARAEPSPTDVRGRGLRIVAALADDVDVSATGGVVTVRCWFDQR